MPNFDQTGPMGQGPLTGRRRGRCRDSQTQQTVQSEESNEIIYGLGRGGRRRGSGLGNRLGTRKGDGRGFGRRFGNK